MHIQPRRKFVYIDLVFHVDPRRVVSYDTYMNFAPYHIPRSWNNVREYCVHPWYSERFRAGHAQSPQSDRIQGYRHCKTKNGRAENRRAHRLRVRQDSPASETGRGVGGCAWTRRGQRSSHEVLYSIFTLSLSPAKSIDPAGLVGEKSLSRPSTPIVRLGYDVWESCFTCLCGMTYKPQYVTHAEDNARPMASNPISYLVFICTFYK